MMECLPAPVNATTTIVGSTLSYLPGNGSSSPFLDSSAQLAYPKHGVIRDITYLDLWEMEKDVDLNFWIKWHDDYWQVPVIASAIYLVTIFGIQKFLKNRKPFNLRNPLLTWNVGLAIFSIVGFLRCLPGFLVTLGKPSGLYSSICRTDTRDAAMVFWGIAFGLSKLVELGDTLFIVLRKRPLMFLHYYHHVTVLCYVWLTASAYNSATLWFGMMNYGVHSLMYSYYALKAMQVKVPKTLAMSITALQLLQMVAGVGVNTYILLAKYCGYSCATESSHVYFALLMYGTYFLLFAKFFFVAYLKQKKVQKSD